MDEEGKEKKRMVRPFLKESSRRTEMGTRADFYVGTGAKAEWIGSMAWDGYPDGRPSEVIKATTAEDFRREVGVLSLNEDFTTPEQGWPWPWKNSHLTDYSYAYEDGKVWATCFGYDWFDPLQPQPEQEETEEKKTIFPEMTGYSAKAGSARSGIMVISAKQQEDGK